jgi:predicted phosphodiesterase
MDIELIATEGGEGYGETLILETLGTKYYIPEHGGLYTGKPGTRIYASERYVVKVHQEYSLSVRDARHWVESKLEKERELAIHHPCKTWFLIHQPSNSYAANITPKLHPLHLAQPHATIEQHLRLLVAMAEMYLKTAAVFNKKLDDGLSNYGVDRDGRLYYLDDDIYSWDNFTSFSVALGAWFRLLEWLTSAQAEQLGSSVAEMVMRYFGDRHCIIILAEQLRSLFLVNTNQQARCDAFLHGLYSKYKNKSANVKNTDRYLAIIADVHANYPALQAVIRELKKLDISQGIVLGDTVGYGPHPKECIATLAKSQYAVIKGNHDHAAASNYFGGGFSNMAKTAILWSQNILNENEKNWLAGLPTYIQRNDWLAVHGAPTDKSFFYAYVYQRTAEDNLANLAERGIAICFHGHSHIVGGYYVQKNISGFCQDPQLNLSSYQHSLICPGSVGQPRGGRQGAEFAIYDQEARKIFFRRCEYDLEPVIQDMRNNNFHPGLINRLLQAT